MIDKDILNGEQDETTTDNNTREIDTENTGSDEVLEDVVEAEESTEAQTDIPAMDISADEQPKSGGKKGTVIAIAMLAVAVIGLFGYFFATKSGPFAPPSPDDVIVMTVGDVEVSAAEYNYMYAVSTNNFLTNNSSMLSYFAIDFEKPLSEQECSINPEIGSWADYFRDIATSAIHYNYGMLDAANKAGFEPSQDTYDSIATSIATIETSAESENLTVDEYVEEFIGEGITFETISNVITTIFTVNEYNQTIIDAVDISQDAIDAYYDESSILFNTYTFRNMFFDNTSDPDSAKSDAEEMLNNLTDTNFKELADVALGEETLSTLPEGYDYTLASVEGQALYDDALKEFLVDPARVAGDQALVEIDQGYYVVEFISAGKNTAPSAVNFKHILISFNEDGSEPTEEQKAAALQEIESITAEWEAGGATDELFAELVTLHSDDPGSMATGGEYTDVADGDMVAEINDFVFSTDTNISDYEIIETTFGYHLTVLTAKGAESWVLSISDHLINDAMIAAENNVLENTPLTTEETIDEHVVINLDLSDYVAVG